MTSLARDRWVKRTARLGLDDADNLFLLGDGDEPDHRRLGPMGEGSTYRKVPRDLLAEFEEIEDFWRDDQGDRLSLDQLAGEELATYRRQQLGGEF